MEIIKPTPSQAAAALKKFLASQNINIKLSQAQEAIAVTNGYPSWNVLAADIPTRAPKTVPADGAKVLGPEGLELWAITCRVAGDDDDSLYIVWGASEGEATEIAHYRLKEDSGIDPDEPEAEEDDDEGTLIFDIGSEKIGTIVNGAFKVTPSLAPPKPKKPRKQVKKQEEIPANEPPAGPSLKELSEMDALLQRKNISDEDDRLRIIQEVMETAASESRLFDNWRHQGGRGECYMEDAGPFIQVSYDRQHGERFATEIVLTLRDAKVEAYVRTWEFKNMREYFILDEQSGDYDTNAEIPEPTSAEPEPMFLALIRNALKEADEHKRRLQARFNLD